MPRPPAACCGGACAPARGGVRPKGEGAERRDAGEDPGKGRSPVQPVTRDPPQRASGRHRARVARVETREVSQSVSGFRARRTVFDTVAVSAVLRSPDDAATAFAEAKKSVWGPVGPVERPKQGHHPLLDIENRCRVALPDGPERL